MGFCLRTTVVSAGPAPPQFLATARGPAAVHLRPSAPEEPAQAEVVGCTMTRNGKPKGNSGLFLTLGDTG